MKHIKNFNLYESINELPKSINIDTELALINDLDAQKDELDINDIIDQKTVIEDDIKAKLWDTMLQYCNKGDYEGAKRFVGSSYKDTHTSGKVLLFRSILVHQKQN